MMMSLGRNCPECRKYAQVSVLPQKPVVCPYCAKSWAEPVDTERVFERCPACLAGRQVCQATQFYLQKDFHQALGCLIMLIGIVLVPLTFGLSLVVFAAVDWLFYKRVPSMAVCYRCHSEFRGFKIPAHLKPFMHHIGVRYDK